MNTLAFLVFFVIIIFFVAIIVTNDHRARHRRYEYEMWRNGVYPPAIHQPRYSDPYEVEDYISRENERRVFATVMFVVGLFAVMFILAAVH